jgi:hypothetical protein
MALSQYFSRTCPNRESVADVTWLNTAIQLQATKPDEAGPEQNRAFFRHLSHRSNFKWTLFRLRHTGSLLSPPLKDAAGQQGYKRELQEAAASM